MTHGKLVGENTPIKDAEQLCSVSREQKREVDLKSNTSKCRVISDTSSFFLIFQVVGKTIISLTAQLGIDVCLRLQSLVSDCVHC